MPLVSRRMVEDHVVREIPIMFDEIRKVHRSLVTLVLQDSVIRLDIVCDIDIPLPVWEVLFYPAGIFLLDAGDNNGFADSVLR